MSENMIDILKGAILLEINGKTFYESVAKQTGSESVKDIFDTMAAEEQKHIAILSDHYTKLVKNGTIEPKKYQDTPDSASSAVLIEKICNEISGADFEAAAISAAMAMEEKAVQYYSERAETSNDENEVALFRWLANWERTHLQFLSDLDRELKEQIWSNNQFWPM
ncbi:MAG: ferritin family protein [Calditrichaeota bacterium]|nr:ferritin family protein [Calditrichota bacterium]